MIVSAFPNGTPSSASLSNGDGIDAQTARALRHNLGRDSPSRQAHLFFGQPQPKNQSNQTYMWDPSCWHRIQRLHTGLLRQTSLLLNWPSLFPNTGQMEHSGWSAGGRVLGRKGPAGGLQDHFSVWTSPVAFWTTMISFPAPCCCWEPESSFWTWRRLCRDPSPSWTTKNVPVGGTCRDAELAPPMLWRPPRPQHHHAWRCIHSRLGCTTGCTGSTGR